MQSTEPTKVFFELEQDEDDWPPVGTESIWADALGPSLFRLRNVPFFAVGVAMGDVVRSEQRDGAEWFVEVAEPSSNSTLHVFCFDNAKRQVLADWLKGQGWEWEYGFDREYLAVNVPRSPRAGEMLSLLSSLEKVEEFEYEFSVNRLSP